MNLEKLRIKNFKPYTKEINRDDCTCGGHLCAVISGISINHIKKLHPQNDDWSEDWVRTFLLLSGYEMIEIDKSFLEKRRGFKVKIKKDHLIIVLIGIDKREMTWACVYKDKCYHGQDMFKGMSGFDVFLNCPLYKMWICHKARK